MRRTQPTVAGIKERGLKTQAKKCVWPLDPGRGKEIDSPLVSSEGIKPS